MNEAKKALDVVNISVDWNSSDSIESADKLKFKLECKGWKTSHSFGGLNHSVTVMIKTQ